MRKLGLSSSGGSSPIRSYRVKPDNPSSRTLIWTRIELQLFLAIVLLIRWLTLNKPRRLGITTNQLTFQLFKYFSIACDMLDFLAITQDSILSQNTQLVYWTLSAWSWSTVQFFICVPKFAKNSNELLAYLNNSLLSVFFLDLPYFGIRIAAIFAFGSHSYNSYFFATKNLVLIILQFYK